MSASGRLSVAFLFLIGGFIPSALRAAEPPSDVMVTFQARRALDDDERLSPFNLGVQVRGGVASLIGRVPTPELVTRAEECVRKVRGVQSVRNALVVGTLTEDPPLRMPTEVRPATPQPEPVALMAPVLTAPGHERPTVSLSGRTQNPTTGASDRAVWDAVDRLRWADPRFLRVQVEVREGVVRLSGQVVRGEDGMDLARMASRVRGVTDVILETREAPVFPGRTP